MGRVMPRATLEQNIAAYERMQDQLEAEHMGQWVVVDNQQLIDAFDDFQDAADLVIEKIGPGCPRFESPACRLQLGRAAADQRPLLHPQPPPTPHYKGPPPAGAALALVTRSIPGKPSRLARRTRDGSTPAGLDRSTRGNREVGL